MIKQLIEKLEELEHRANKRRGEAYSFGYYADAYKTLLEEAQQLQEKIRCENCFKFDPECPCEVSCKDAFCNAWEEKE